MLSGYSNQDAVDLLKKTGQEVELKIVRYLRGLKFEELQDGISKANNLPTNASPTLTDASMEVQHLPQTATVVSLVRKLVQHLFKFGFWCPSLHQEPLLLRS